MGRGILLALAAAWAATATQPAAAQSSPSCEMDAPERARLLTLGYQDFDQTPGNGWRGLVGEDDSCASDVAELIDEYTLRSAADLTEFNVQILNWHAGQLYGFGGRNSLARQRFVAALNPAEAEGAPPWNAYVRASVAFLDGDLEGIRRQRRLIAATESQMNLAVVDRLIAGFGKSYADAHRGR